MSHALRGLYELASILIVLDEVLCLEISNLARQLKFSPEIGDDHPVICHLTPNLWFLRMELTIADSTSSAKRSIIDRKSIAGREIARVNGLSLEPRKRKMES